jgi:hypothetical protein
MSHHLYRRHCHHVNYIKEHYEVEDSPQVCEMAHTPDPESGPSGGRLTARTGRPCSPIFNQGEILCQRRLHMGCCGSVLLQWRRGCTLTPDNTPALEGCAGVLGASSRAFFCGGAPMFYVYYTTSQYNYLRCSTLAVLSPSRRIIVLGPGLIRGTPSLHRRSKRITNKHECSLD